jgi:hypothetical protein
MMPSISVAPHTAKAEPTASVAASKTAVLPNSGEIRDFIPIRTPKPLAT